MENACLVLQLFYVYSTATVAFVSAHSSYGGISLDCDTVCMDCPGTGMSYMFLASDDTKSEGWILPNNIHKNVISPCLQTML